MRKGRDGRLKAAYKSAFEESFVDNYGAWSATMKDVNMSIMAIAENHKRKKIEPYKYDDFCCLVKMIIGEKMDSIDWDHIINDEVGLVLFKKRKVDNSQMVIRAHALIDKIESDVLFTCFERAIKERIGNRLYGMYKSEIVDLRKCDITL